MNERQPLWTLAEIATVTGTEAPSDAPIQGIAIDSRETNPGDLFVALPGTQSDGHEYLTDAFGRGASAALVRQDKNISGNLGGQLIRVSDTLEALRQLAVESRRRMAGRVIAVTGSAGKTGTRDAIYRALRGFGPTHSSIRSFNNHVGVPLSLARMPRESGFAVFEVGMSAPGEIRDLANLIAPHIAVITSIGEAHLEGFAGARQIAEAKAEVFERMSGETVAVINGDSEFTPFLIKAAKAAGVGKVICASLENAKFAVHAERLAVHGDCNCLTAQVCGYRMTFRVGLPGRHWAMNSLLVLGTVQAAGGDLGLAGLALANLQPMSGRGERHRIALDRGTFLLIDESYNANPQSVTACLEVLGREQPRGSGRRIALFGDMDELGGASSERHLGLQSPMHEAKLNAFFAAGSQMRQLARAVGADIHAPIIEDRQRLLELLMRYLRPGDVLLVKGSNSQRMSECVEALLRWAEQNQGGLDHPPMAAE
jgi:UDP-N-acetylmuramoyl-tripeptide--D-alanyl-D-alanine ligase